KKRRNTPMRSSGRQSRDSANWSCVERRGNHAGGGKGIIVLLQLVQNRGEFAGGLSDIFFLENGFVIAGTDFDQHAASGVSTPTHLVIKGADERVAASAKERDSACVRLRLVLEPGLDVSAPEFAFVLRSHGEIDD